MCLYIISTELAGLQGSIFNKLPGDGGRSCPIAKYLQKKILNPALLKLRQGLGGALVRASCF